MVAEILCVGTELLLGDIVNTNAAYLAKQLASLGIDLYTQSVVGDNPERLKESLAIAFSRADLVLMTGGLGPTYDDLTKETVAAYFGRKMQRDEHSYQRLMEYFAKVGKEPTPNNLKQADMPEGAVVFDNDNGTAPGLAVEGNGKIAVLMPGPPYEMTAMFEARIRPYLQKFSEKVLVSRTIRIVGMGESEVEYRLRDYMLSHLNPTVAPYAKQSEVQLRVTASAKTQEQAYALIEPVVAEIQEMLGDVVYGVDVENMEQAVVQQLKEKGLKVATAESCTGGLISKRITEIPGASDVFECGVCSYANRIKHELLGVSQRTLEQFGAVSEQTAREMAEGIRRLSGADIGVSVTGIAGPGGGTPEKPVGLVYLGVSSEGDSKVVRYLSGSKKAGSREHIRYIASQQALKLVLEAIRANKKK